MKINILIVLFFSIAQMSLAQAPPCNATLIGTNTTIISSTMLMDSVGSTSAQGNILICAGNTLTYNWYLGKDFYVRNGATLILKSAQIAKISLEAGATLIFDTVGQIFPGGTLINGITYDSTNVTFVDTNQINIPSSAVYWNNCPGNTFNYTAFTPVQPCIPLAIVDNSLETLLNISFENPVRDNIKLSQTVLEQIAKIRIVDMTGKVISETSELLHRINVSNLPNGIYLLQLNNKQGASVIKKFMKD